MVAWPARGVEVYAYDSAGNEQLLTPGASPMCSCASLTDAQCNNAAADSDADPNSARGARMWSTSHGLSSIAGQVTGLDGPLPTLPGAPIPDDAEMGTVNPSIRVANTKGG